uniref:Transthyretin-like family protein n=1 Tax=Bursaphelenchus xylophilus TaxID=6326 RepID=A0A1I7RII5_BURXY
MIFKYAKFFLIYTFSGFKTIGKTFLLLTLTFFVGTAEIFGRDQAAGATGKLLCKGKPAVGVSVKLWDDDSPDLDDKMDETTTDSEGRFQLEGHAREYTNIDPKINIDHDCDDRWLCQRRLTIYIPDSYINDGGRAERFYDVGVIELSGEFEGEKRDCIH